MWWTSPTRGSKRCRLARKWKLSCFKLAEQEQRLPPEEITKFHTNQLHCRRWWHNLVTFLRSLVSCSYDVYAPLTATRSMLLSNTLTVKSGGVYTVVIQHNVTDSNTVSTAASRNIKWLSHRTFAVFKGLSHMRFCFLFSLISGDYSEASFHCICKRQKALRQTITGQEERACSQVSCIVTIVASDGGLRRCGSQ